MAKVQLTLPAAPLLESSLHAELRRAPRDPARTLSLVGVANWRRKARVFFRAVVALDASVEESVQRVRFPLDEDLPAPRTTALLSVSYWIVSEIGGTESERWPVAFVVSKSAPAVPLQLVARRSADEPSIELALRSSCIATRIEGALAVQAPLAKPARIELHQVLEWRPGTFSALREESMVAISHLPVERLPVGKTCLFVISVPGGSALSWTHADYRARWFLRVHADFIASKWSFDVDVELSASRHDGERSPKLIPRVGTNRHRHELHCCADEELRVDDSALRGAFGSTTLSVNYGVTLEAELDFPDVGVDLSDVSDHARSCRLRLLASQEPWCVEASNTSLRLQFQLDDLLALRRTLASLKELARGFDASIEELPVFPPLEHALPAWQSLSELLGASLSPAGLILRVLLERQTLEIRRFGAGIRMATPCIVAEEDPRLSRFESRLRNTLEGPRLVREEALLVLLVDDELGSEGSPLTAPEAARVARDFAAFTADFTRTGAYR